MKGSRRIAVVGATGLVGWTICRLLGERGFPAGELLPVATEASRGARVEACSREWEVGGIEDLDPEGLDYCFFSAGEEVSRRLGLRMREAGVKVIDNTRAFRLEPDVPLVVPEINGSLVGRDTLLVASPNCTTIILALTLAPLAEYLGVEQVAVASYQSVSGSGKDALGELRAQAVRMLEGGNPEPGVYPKPISFNCLPWVGDLPAQGFSLEEEKIKRETRKILSLPDLPVFPTAVRIPVEVGHGLAVAVRLGRCSSRDEVMELFRRAEGIDLGDEIPTPLEVAGRDEVLVGRVRFDPEDNRFLMYWVVGDNLRKGAATNCVQIAELMEAAGR